MNVLGLNAFDLLLIVVVFVGALIGFVRGFVPQVISLVSIWIGLIATLWLYQPLSNRVLRPETSGFGMNKTPADTLAFLILLIVFFNAFRLIVKYLAVPPEEKRKKRKKKKFQDDPLAEGAPSAMQRFFYGPINAIGGIIMGFILTVLWLSLLLGVLQFIFQPTGAPVPYTGFLYGLVTNMKQSTLLPLFNMVLSGLVSSVNLFIPTDVRNDNILKAFLQFIG